MSRHVATVVLVYAIGFVLLWPRGVVVIDESDYISAASTFAKGATSSTVTDGITAEVTEVRPSDYPPGTSAIAAPFVGLFGARAAPLVSMLSYCATGLLLARWLSLEKRSPVFALLFLGYLPALALGRVLMSDLPSAFMVCAAQMLLFESGPRDGLRPSISKSVAAGFVAGLSLLFRETNAVFLVPFFVGAILRREGRSLALVGGGALGLVTRLVASSLAFGDPFFIKAHRDWSLQMATSHLGLHLFALLVLAPLGLAAGLAYRGRRRPELVATVVCSFGFFAAFEYAADESGGLKQLVLGPRYFIPLVPILAIALAEVAPRYWRTWGEPGGTLLPRVLANVWTAAVVAAIAIVQVTLARFAVTQSEISEALMSATTDRGALIFDSAELGKHLQPWRSPRRPVDIDMLAPADLPRLVARDGVAFFAILERDDSAFQRDRAAAAEGWRAHAAMLCSFEPMHDEVHGSTRLRVFRIRACRSS